MENKKSGIRLRHLEQQPEEPPRRDLSPNNPNRKKIFEKNQRAKPTERPHPDERQRKKTKNEEEGFNEYEELVENLKKKTMEVEVRDETIKYLNKQIEELKAHLKLKDREIAKLTQDIALQKEQQTLKTTPKENVFESFKSPSPAMSYPYEPSRTSNHGQSPEIINAKPKAPSQERQLNEEISMGNLNAYKNSFQENGQETEILSPFMALNNTHSSFSRPPEGRKETKTSRISNLSSQPDFHHTSTDYSGFQKRKTNHEFDFSREEYVPKRTMIDSVNKQLEKFNIFGEPEKKEILARSKLEIEDSREFKFEEFEEKGYGEFGPNMDQARKERLLGRIKDEGRRDAARLQEYLDALVVKRNRTSLVMNSFMHNVVDIENSVETTREFLK